MMQYAYSHRMIVPNMEVQQKSSPYVTIKMAAITLALTQRSRDQIPPFQFFGLGINLLKVRSYYTATALQCPYINYISAPSLCSITAFQVKMNLFHATSHNAVTSNGCAVQQRIAIAVQYEQTLRASIRMHFDISANLTSQAHILESVLNIVHPHPRNKSDFTDLIFSCFVSRASYQLKTLNIVKSSN